MPREAADRVVLGAFGTTVGICGDAAVVHAAARLLPAFYESRSGAPQRWWRVAVGEGADPAADAGLTATTSEIERWVAATAPGLIFVHAGAVAVGDRAVVVPGRSHAGKSTLVAALLRAGARYLSDEYAAFDADGCVRGYPRPLSLRDADGRRSRLDPAEIGASVAPGPVPLGLVAALRYDPRARWSVEEVTPARSVLSLVDNAVAAQTRTGEVLRTLGRAVVDADVGICGSRGEAEGAAAQIMGRLGAGGVRRR